MSANGAKIRVGVSACLIGEKVRWNGDHKQDQYIWGLLSDYFEWISVCPEVDIDMGIPREPVRLTGSLENPLMVGIKSGQDWTVKMKSYSRSKSAALVKQTLGGFIFKKGSPSCGLMRVAVYGKNNIPLKQGTGLFAAHVIKQFPHLPVEEEGRLNDAKIRENFIIRVFGYQRLRAQSEVKYSRRAWIDFHTRHKYLLLSHHQNIYREMGRLVASIKDTSPKNFVQAYSDLFMRALTFKATVKKHLNVLQHMAGFVKRRLDKLEKNELNNLIQDYAQGLVPLIVPITLLTHYVRKFDIKFLADQVYLNPHPKELMLRNHV